jgi:hypothetical protein
MALQRRFADHLGVLITHQSLSGTWPARDDLRERLARLDRTEVVLRIAWINFAAHTWRLIKDNTRDQEIRNYLFPFWTDAFEAWTAQYGDGFVFSRYTLLWLLRQALTVCLKEGGLRLDTIDAFQVFGEAVLIANDLATLPAPKQLRTTLELAANFMPLTEYFTQEDYDREVARTLYLFTELVPRGNDAVKTLPVKIAAFLGFPVLEYCDLAFSCAMKPLAADTRELRTLQIPSLAPEHFGPTSIPPERAAAFLASMSDTHRDSRTPSPHHRRLRRT